LGVAALTLKRLAEEISQAAECESRLISNVGRKLLLEETAREHYADGAGRLAPLRDFPGFTGALDTLFGELKQALIDADQFAAIARRLPHSENLLELAALFARYNDALAGHGVMDRHDMELAALRHLQRGGLLPPLFDDVGKVEMHAIYDLIPLQLALVAAISRRLPVRLNLPYNPVRESLYAYAAKTTDAIESLDNSDLLLEPVFAEPSGTFLSPLLDAHFAEGGENCAPFRAPGPMALLAAPGTYRECEEIGRRIRGLLEEGVDPACVAVLFRDLQSYGPRLEDVCRRFGIPVSFRRGAPLHTASLIRACLAPFALVRSRFAREDLLSLCNSSYFAPPGAAVFPDIVEEVLLAAHYMDETLGKVEEALARRIDFLRKAGKSPSREEQLRRFLLPLLSDLRRFQGDKTIGKFIELLEGFIDKYRLYRQGIAASDLRALKRDASAVTIFRQLLRDLESDLRTLGMADRRLSPAAFAELLREGMEGMFLAGERSAGVAIMNFHDARGLTFDHLFIGGLNEGVTPRRHDGHPLFMDNAKLLWQKAAGVKPFRTAAEKTLEEPLLFYLAVGCAASSLTFSYSYIDSRGNAMLRSPFLDDILSTIPLPETRTLVSSITPDLPFCLEREELLNTLAAHGVFTLAAQRDAAPVRESLGRIAANAGIEGQREAFFAAEGTALRTALSSPYTGSLQRADIVTELRAFFTTPPGNCFAPTTLEEYGCCPFRYFLQRLVGVSPLEKPDLELEARDEGSLAHELLHAFFQRLADEERLPLRDVLQAQATLRETAEELFARWEKERHTGEPLLWEIGKERLLSLLERMVEIEGEDSSGLVPRLFEHPFSGLEVADPDGSRISLTGKIDRLDVACEGRLRVVDYKMAGDRQKYRELLKMENLGITSFQMPVYLLAAVRELERTTGSRFDRFSALFWLLRRLDPLTVDFTPAKSGDYTGFFAIDPEERRELGNKNFLNRLCATVHSMKGGEFQISPKECEFCRFRSVCRYVEVNMREEET
ncbi:MAG TPA: PD-(D/E)XK nuclease family protein, partial [Geobacteraceae bacterium]|nr:PD-(D/E)XK nuclease family protein [Geobacteraceae bacterium]